MAADHFPDHFPLIIFLKAHPDFNAPLRNTLFPAASFAQSWEGEAETQKVLFWLVGTDQATVELWDLGAGDQWWVDARWQVGSSE